MKGYCHPIIAKVPPIAGKMAVPIFITLVWYPMAEVRLLPEYRSPINVKLKIPKQCIKSYECKSGLTGLLDKFS